MTTTKMAGGPREGVAESYNALVTGTLLVGEAQQPLVSTNTPVFSVLIQVPTGLVGTLYVGTSEHQYVSVVAGREITIRVRDLNLIYVRAEDFAGPAGGLRVNWIAEA
jgi:hypothetical protein